MLPPSIILLTSLSSPWFFSLFSPVNINPPSSPTSPPPGRPSSNLRYPFLHFLCLTVPTCLPPPSPAPPYLRPSPDYRPLSPWDNLDIIFSLLFRVPALNHIFLLSLNWSCSIFQFKSSNLRSIFLRDHLLLLPFLTRWLFGPHRCWTSPLLPPVPLQRISHLLIFSLINTLA